MNIFQGGFLGLDNIGVFDRSAPLPTGGHIAQSDGTIWMAMYALNLQGFRRYFIPPDIPFWFEVEVGGRAVFHSRTVRGDEWIQLKSGEVMTMRYPFEVR